VCQNWQNVIAVAQNSEPTIHPHAKVGSHNRIIVRRRGKGLVENFIDILGFVGYIAAHIRQSGNMKQPNGTRQRIDTARQRRHVLTRNQDNRRSGREMGSGSDR
jgi:hypothetical protein